MITYKPLENTNRKGHKKDGTARDGRVQQWHLSENGEGSVR